MLAVAGSLADQQIGTGEWGQILTSNKGLRGAASWVKRWGWPARHGYSDRTLRQVGEQMGGMRYPAVTMAVRRFGKTLQKDKLLRKKIKQVCELLLVKM
jgi:hypothetical protein